MSGERRRTALGERLEVPVDEARLAHGWRGIDQRAHAPARGRRHVAAGVVALAAAAALVLVLRPGSEPERVASAAGPLAPAGAEGAGLDAALRAASARGEDVALDDGSVITVTRGAALEALENTGDRVSLLLRAGRAHFEVRPGGPRRWTIEAGLLTVEVVGTAFEVVRGEAGVRVRVDRGRVLVRGDAVPDRVLALSAGESFELDAPPSAPRAGSDVESHVESHVDGDRESDLESEPAGGAARPARRAVTAEVPIATLLERADEARRAGRVEDALEGYAAAARRQGDPQAAVASLTRGRLALELGRAPEAVRDLRRAVAAGLPPALEETARARLVDALARSGDRAGAVREAEEYTRRYPGGAWRESVARAIAPAAQ